MPYLVHNIVTGHIRPCGPAETRQIEEGRFVFNPYLIHFYAKDSTEAVDPPGLWVDAESLNEVYVDVAVRDGVLRYQIADEDGVRADAHGTLYISYKCSDIGDAFSFVSFESKDWTSYAISKNNLVDQFVSNVTGVAETVVKQEKEPAWVIMVESDDRIDTYDLDSPRSVAIQDGHLFIRTKGSDVVDVVIACGSWSRYFLRLAPSDANSFSNTHNKAFDA